MATRIQFCYNNILQAEVIVEGGSWESHIVSAKYFNLKHKRGLGFGGAIHTRQDIRTWNVSVGGEIPQNKE